MFDYVDWFSHYSRSNFQPATLKLGYSFLPPQPTCIWYINSSTICSPLPLVSFIKVSDDFKSQTKGCSLSLPITLFTPLCLTPLTWSLLSSSLLPHHQHSWPFLRITILITSYFLCWLQPRQQSSLPSYSIFNLKLSTDSITISFWHPILIFYPLTRNHNSTKPQNHNSHWLQISSLFCTKQLYDTPQTKIARFGFFPTSLRSLLVLVELTRPRKSLHISSS